MKMTASHYQPDRKNKKYNCRAWIPHNLVHLKTKRFLRSAAGLLFIFSIPTIWSQEIPDKYKGKILKGNIGGYMITDKQKADQSYNAGFSVYAAAWPLLRNYPGNSFQSGLFGTWMHPQYDDPLPVEKLYTDIEGGLGWWRNTRFPTETPKFIMGGVQLNFSGWANGPGAGKGRDWKKPQGKYGVAQLSPWILFPPDGLNLKQGTCGELFGYGYVPLPLTNATSTTAGKNVPTGNQSWTLFLNTGNFKGPVAFFTPYFWSQASVKNPGLKGLFLDQRPSKANKPFQMETQYIHSVESTDTKGQAYIRIAPTQYPVGPNGHSNVLHRLMVYNKEALWNDVDSWFKGGRPVEGPFNLKGAHMEKFHKGIRSNWKVYGDHIPENKRALLNIATFLDAKSSDSSTYRLHWNSELITKIETDQGALVVLPEYYRLVKEEPDGNGTWIAIAPKDVPAETGLQKVSFSTPDRGSPEAYITPDDKKGSWKRPGPVAGPYSAKLGDGSTVTYYWYRFADQPALLNAALTPNARKRLQERVEKLHRHWTKDREYLPPPMEGKLADIDPALIVSPPLGLEIGYVPIITWQGME